MQQVQDPFEGIGASMAAAEAAAAASRSIDNRGGGDGDGGTMATPDHSSSSGSGRSAGLFRQQRGGAGEGRGRGGRGGPLKQGSSPTVVSEFSFPDDAAESIRDMAAEGDNEKVGVEVMGGTSTGGDRQNSDSVVGDFYVSSASETDRFTSSSSSKSSSNFNVATSPPRSRRSLGELSNTSPSSRSHTSSSRKSVGSSSSPRSSAGRSSSRGGVGGGGVGGGVGRRNAPPKETDDDDDSAIRISIGDDFDGGGHVIREDATAASEAPSEGGRSFMVMAPLLREEDGEFNHLLQEPAAPAAAASGGDDADTDADPSAALSVVDIDATDVEVARLGEGATRHMAVGQYDEAMGCYQRLLAAARDVVENVGVIINPLLPEADDPLDGDDAERAEELSRRYHLVIADTLNNVGVMYEMTGEYEYGLRACREALSIYKKMLKRTTGEDDGDAVAAAATRRQEIEDNVRRTKNNAAQMTRARGSLAERTRLHQMARGYRNGMTAGAASTPGDERESLREALKLYRKVLALERSTLGRSHPQVGRTLVQIGEVQHQLGGGGGGGQGGGKKETDDAMQSLNMALFLLKSSLGGDHPDVALALLAVANVHEARGETDDAIKCYADALAIQTMALGEDHRDVASTLNNVGVLHFTVRNYPESLTAYRRAIAVYTRILQNEEGDGFEDGHHRPRNRNNHSEVALLWNNVGEVYRAQRDYGAAMEAYEKALSMLRATVGDGHEYVITTLLNIGVVHAKNRDYDASLYLYGEALKAQTRAGPGKEADVAVTLKSIGVLWEKKGDLAEAMRYYEEALRVRRGALGEDHVDNARLLSSIGTVHEKRGRHEEALIYHSEALRLYLHHGLSDKHSCVRHTREKISAAQKAAAVSIDEPRRGDAATQLDEIAVDHGKNGDVDESLACYAEALWARRRAKGDDHVDVARTLGNIASIYEKRREMPEAMTAYAESLRIYRHNGLGYQHPNVKGTVHQMNQIRSMTSPLSS